MNLSSTRAGSIKRDYEDYLLVIAIRKENMTLQSDMMIIHGDINYSCLLFGAQLECGIAKDNNLHL